MKLGIREHFPYSGRNDYLTHFCPGHTCLQTEVARRLFRETTWLCGRTLLTGQAAEMLSMRRGREEAPSLDSSSCRSAAVPSVRCAERTVQDAFPPALDVEHRDFGHTAARLLSFHTQCYFPPKSSRSIGIAGLRLRQCEMHTLSTNEVYMRRDGRASTFSVATCVVCEATEVPCTSRLFSACKDDDDVSDTSFTHLAERLLGRALTHRFHVVARVGLPRKAVSVFWRSIGGCRTPTK